MELQHWIAFLRTLEIDRSTAVKTLFLLWFPQSDLFMFKIPALHELNVITNRSVVSEMSRLFDPNGLLGPVIIKAKIFVRTLWAETLPWDMEFRRNLQEWWLTIPD